MLPFARRAAAVACARQRQRPSARVRTAVLAAALRVMITGDSFVMKAVARAAKTRVRCSRVVGR